MVSYQLRTTFYAFMCTRGIRYVGSNDCVMVLVRRGTCVTVSDAITDLRMHLTRLYRFHHYETAGAQQPLLILNALNITTVG